MWSSVELLRKELTHIPAAFHDDRATPKAAISNHLNTIDRKAELRQDELKLAAVCGMAVTFAWVNRRTPWEGTDVEELWSASFYGLLPLPQWRRNHVPLAGAKQLLTRHEGGKHATTFSRS